MKKLDSLTIYYGGKPRSIELYSGDIADLAADPVDCLVVSAFPNDYSPTPSSLAGTLHRCGVSLSKLSEKMAADLRENCSCWWSDEINIAGSPARRILCFEPGSKADAANRMGDVFQSLTTMILSNSSVHTVAMPLLTAGDQQGSVSDLFPALVEAAVRWIEAGLAITCLKLVERDELKVAEMKGAFSVLKRIYSDQSQDGDRTHHDIFISYCHEDSQAVDQFISHLRNTNPALRLFRDTQDFKPGTMWCQELFDAIEHSRKVVAFLSKPYLNSRMCREEWNIANLRRVNSGREVLFPILLFTAQLPTHMQVVQYEDCREGDRAKLAAAGEKVLASLRR